MICNQDRGGGGREEREREKKREKDEIATERII